MARPKIDPFAIDKKVALQHIEDLLYGKMAEPLKWLRLSCRRFHVAEDLQKTLQWLLNDAKDVRVSRGGGIVVPKNETRAEKKERENEEDESCIIDMIAFQRASANRCRTLARQVQECWYACEEEWENTKRPGKDNMSHERAFRFMDQFDGRRKYDHLTTSQKNTLAMIVDVVNMRYE